MVIHILTLFPDMFAGPLTESIVKRAIEKEAVQFDIVNIRDFTNDLHHTTDQPPYGGGPGMVMMVEPIDQALTSLKKPNSKSQMTNLKTNDDTLKTRTVLLSAKGSLYTQTRAREFAALDELTLICGHYEGVDERVAEHLIDEEIRVGDYVLTGGELPAMMIADSVIRLLPGVLGDETSSEDESHSTPGYLEYPQYTRPSEYKGWKVPEILLGGNHAQIQKWRQEQAKNG